MNLNLNLNLKKPLVFLKVATTGNEPVDKKQTKRDRIIELSITRIEADRQTVKTGTRLINPGFPIPIESTMINGIKDEDVVNMPKFEDIAQNIYSFIGDADFAGFGIINFDLKFLTEEFNKAGIDFNIYGRKIIDLSEIFYKMEKRDFRAAASIFANKDFDSSPISSQTANLASIEIFNGMVSKYSHIEAFSNANPDILDDEFNKIKKALDVQNLIVLNSDKRPVFNFGKYKNLLVADMMISDPEYYDWFVNVSDLPSDTKKIVKKIVEKAKSLN